MTYKMNYPCTISKKIDDDGDIVWKGEQKQLGVFVEEYSYEDCVRELEREIRAVFRRMSGTDEMDSLVRYYPISERGVVAFLIPVNHTLSEFMANAPVGKVERGVADEQ